MKILHTADWHIGKVVNGFSMLEDQVYILKQIIAVIRREKPDVVVIAGDLYDRSIPPVAAVRLLNETLREIVQQNQTKVIAIAGNHDSNERIQFASDLLKESGLFLIGVLQNPFEKIVLEDADGAVHFYPIPYTDPLTAAEIYADESIRTHEAAMKRIMEEITKDLDANVRNVAVAHGYFSMMKTEEERIEDTELMLSDSEKRLSVGGSDLVDARHFQPFGYTALGHLHGHQKAGPNARYSGSPLKYSFSEVYHKKGVSMIELDKDGQMQERFLLLKPLRDFRIIRGCLADLLTHAEEAGVEDYIRAELLDTRELPGAMTKLQSVYPNAMELVWVEREKLPVSEGKKLQLEGKTPMDLYCSFCRQVTGEEAQEAHIRWLETAIYEWEKERRSE